MSPKSRNFGFLNSEYLRERGGIPGLIGTLALTFFILGLQSCSTLPKQDYKPYSFPSDRAFIGDVKRPYKVTGVVRAKVNYQSLDVEHEEDDLCKNAFNKAARDMIKMAEDKGADAVIKVKSVVFYEGGAHETFPTAECSDDGMEGQVLTEGVAVKWEPFDRPKE